MIKEYIVNQLDEDKERDQINLFNSRDSFKKHHT